MTGTAVSSLKAKFKSRKANDGVKAGNHAQLGLWLFSKRNDDTSVGSSQFRGAWAVARGRMCVVAVLNHML